MRLAALMHRPVAELRETMDAHEWRRWLLFHSLYDLPDAFHVVAQVCTTISRVVGGKGEAEDFSPYFKRDAPQSPSSPQATRPGGNNLKPFYGFLAGYAKDRAASGNPIPRERRNNRTPRR